LLDVVLLSGRTPVAVGWMKPYVVRLIDEERETLRTLTTTGRSAVRTILPRADPAAG